MNRLPHVDLPLDVLDVHVGGHFVLWTRGSESSDAMPLPRLMDRNGLGARTSDAQAGLVNHLRSFIDEGELSVLMVRLSDLSRFTSMLMCIAVLGDAM